MFNLAITLSIGVIAAILKIRLIKTNIINQEPSAKKQHNQRNWIIFLLRMRPRQTFFTEIDFFIEKYDDDYDCYSDDFQSEKTIS